jgi:hypothetical protein
MTGVVVPLAPDICLSTVIGTLVPWRIFARDVASVEGASKISVDIRYEEAQITGRVEVTAPQVDLATSLQRLDQGEAIQERMKHLEADLQTEFATDQQARITVVIPLA